MSTVMEDIYIAGHFWRMLLVDLNWQLKPPKDIDRRSNVVARRMTTPSMEGPEGMKCKTPSWSWASISGPVFPAMCGSIGHKTSLVTVLSYTMTPVDNKSPQGQVLSATLTVEALCAEVQWMEGTPSILSENFIDDKWLAINMDKSDGKPANGERSSIIALSANTWPREWEGLVLVEVDRQGKIAYERVGHFLYGYKHPKSTFSQQKRLTLV